MPRRAAMHAQPKRTLKRLIKQYGQDLVHDPRRTEALLRDLCGQHTREIFVLVNAQKQRVPADLLAAPAWMPQQATHARLSRALQTKLALTEEAADWAVRAWAEALGLAAAQGRGPRVKWPTLGSKLGLLRRRQQGASHASQSGRQAGVSGVKSKQTSAKQSKRTARRQHAGQQAEVGRRIPVIGWTVPPKLVRYTVQAKSQIGAEPWRTIGMGGLLLVAVLAVLVLAANVTQMSEQRWAGSFSFRGQSIAGRQTQDPSGASRPTGSGSESSPAAGGIAATPTSTPITVQEPGTELSPAAHLLTTYSLPLWGRVSADGLLVREGPSTGYPYITVLSDREAIQVVEFSQDGQWSMINQPAVGWISNDYVRFESQDGSDTTVRLQVRRMHTQSYDVTVRSSPQSAAPGTTTLPPNATVVAVAVTVDGPTTWLQITEPVDGWLSQNDILQRETP